MRHRGRWALTLVVAWAIAWANALEVPRDAEVLLTDAASRIVGVGRTLAGTRFELRLEDGFVGPAVLVWVEPDGTVGRFEVVVRDGAVWVDGHDLRTLLPPSFVEVRVAPASEIDAPGAFRSGRDGDPPGHDRAPQGPPDHAPQGPPDHAPQGPPDHAPQGPPADPPRSDSANPPATPPGRDPDGPPGRR